MPGSSQRKGAIRKKRGNPTAGSGGRVRQGLEGRGPTPKAVDRTKHPAHKRAKAKERAEERESRRRPARKDNNTETVEWVYGRNPVVEALRAGVPAAALHVAEGTERDARLREALLIATQHGISILEVPRPELDRVTAGGSHQGLAIQIPPYEYAHPDDLLDRAYNAHEVPLIVALDGVTDPRNLGAITRSAAAFGAHGVLIPERRAAQVSASAWKTSAGAAARIPVARVTNLNRALKSYKEAGLLVIGLDMGGEVELPALQAATEPIVLVVGSEGKGLARLVRENCDLIVSIPMTSATESLNAGIATGVALYEISRRRAG
ncbi:23S rRNA (guanosine(2251)-2'-O)-methyltransferase RlmB [Kribbella albertanoniae]|uniref:23S rRNA (Guanosine(2251)-2'-O)-methyltransferase RlmB n=1 Tax=Kribbella albertanoniae TaxID=1266829 RepID=A0A4R4PWM2_9ACTN|nr:23S rRNA (guanosine(2251)-2'-O)-methyltransferase RlmB [Kribbella albertanoniae]TDC26926.1 23S rRNA (guanosine(2251)-2'-O)-methyltransferase RlmB [Kribbella albertanoniae]